MALNANFAKSVYANASFPKRHGTDITRSLIADPRAWFNKHAVAFEFDENAVWTAEDAKVNPRSLLGNGASNDSLAFQAGFRFDPVYVSGGGSKPMFLLRTSNEPHDNGVRGLPFRDSMVTYTQLDDNALFFATGPLTGCHIYVAGTRTAPWIFHANKNDDNASVSQNMVAKLRSTLGALAGLGLNAGIAGSLIRTTYSQRDLGGFVFGHRRRDGWRFWTYLADKNLKRRKIIDLPAALS